jgi:SsrA-binding protein
MTHGFKQASRIPAKIGRAEAKARLFRARRLVIVAIRLNSMAEAKEEKILATNRAAFHNYHISTKYEAGASLTGTEVKSVLDGRIQLKESYVAVREGEAWLFNAHISPYTHGNRANHDPLRTRKLLLHRREIDKLDQATSAQGMTLVITRVYAKNRKIKFEVGVAKGKKLYDKREAELRRIVERETRAQLKERNR